MHGRLVAGSLLLMLVCPTVARGQAAAAPTGAPPAEATALVAAPAAAGAEPKIEKPVRETTATASAGGQIVTGNSRLIAATINGKVDLRRDANGFGASVLGNYGEGAQPGQNLQVTTQNIQGRARYDRYLIEQLSLFLIGTARHDRFQGLDVRFNVDPGGKYLFVNLDSTKLWAEAGYDFQYDIRRDDARGVVGSNGQPMVDMNGNPVPPLIDKTATDHSARLFVGFKHAFNKDVTFSTGLEYLQSFLEANRYRLNYDALLAANVGAGFSFGVGFTARYDHAPLPGKENTDTATTLSLIYSYSDLPAPPPPPCNCPAPAPASAPAPAPASAPAPAPSPATPTSTSPPSPAEPAPQQ